NVGRSVGAPFTELPDGRIANRLRFRVRNQEAVPVTFEIETAAPAGAETRVVGTTPIALEPGEMTRVEAWIVVPRTALGGGSSDALFRLRFSDGTVEEVPFTLLGPSQ
ncbi:MAG: FixG Ig-like domain-containing protein, partial [Rhodothermales bacterium]|nr:FixG Ig-like domain-containing protein [Rhodothermales bacterium]